MEKSQAFPGLFPLDFTITDAILFNRKGRVYEGKNFHLLLRLFFLGVLNALAQNVTRDSFADLDGDGKQDAIHFSINPKGEYTLEINDISRKGKFPDPNSLCGTAEFQMEIIDIEKQDKYKEVKILMHTDIDSCLDYRHHILWYSGKSITLMWDIQSATPSFPGNGIALVSEWRDFWLQTHKYVLDQKTRTMAYVPQAFYYVGVEAKVNQSMPIYRNINAENIVAELQKDSSCLLLLYDEPSGWYLIKTSAGLVGWIGNVQKLALPSAG